jgi:antitoxin ParD1/3/4
MDPQMTSMNVSLPEPLRKFVEAEVSRGGYSTASEYVRELIREDQRRKANDALESKLLEGLNSPTRVWSKAARTALRKRIEQRLSKRKGETDRK